VLLLVATAASALLSLQKLGALALPGCGIKSPCDAAAHSKWGTIPTLDWPLAYFGLAYFAGLLASWTATRARWGLFARLLATIGAAFSALLIGVMVRDHLLCAYCLASHISNILFVVVVWASPRGVRAPRGLAGILAVFILSSAALVIADLQSQQALKAKAKAEFDASMREIAAQPIKTLPPNESKPAPSDPSKPAPASASLLATQPPADCFTGRYYWGNPNPRIRVVIFAGYQCPDCKAVDRYLQELVKEQPEVQVTLKHFPLCAACNPNMNGQTLHPNACWAARAAEAAGIMGGNDAFQQMSYWLFSMDGGFTDDDLNKVLDAMSFDRRKFKDLMKSDETLKRVQDDIAEGMSLGLTETPLVYVNGFEIRGWQADPKSIKGQIFNMGRVIFARDNSAPCKHPVTAKDRAVKSWLDETATNWGDRRVSYMAAPVNAPVDIQIWGDLLDPGTAKLDQQINELVAGNVEVRYQLRYFPVDKACNPLAPNTVYPNSCLAVKVVESIGRLAGAEAYWKAVRWVFAHQKDFASDPQGTIEKLKDAATDIGFNPVLLEITMNNPEIEKALADEVDLGGRVKLSQIPQLYINSRRVQRWETPDGSSILPRMIELAPRVPR
jgi:uncharacterized membrane protein/predicted DsbA family dithiol-disulfide isomerase